MNEYSKTGMEITRETLKENTVFIKIRGGNCKISPEYVEIQCKEGKENKKENQDNRFIKRSRYMIYAALGVFFFYFSYQSSIREQNYESIAFASLGSLLIILSIIIKGHSKENSILRNRIEKIKVKKGIPMLIAPYLAIYYIDEKNKHIKRFLFLPNFIKNRAEKIKEAKDKIMGTGILID